MASVESHGGDMMPHDEAMLELVAVHALGAGGVDSEECAAVQEHLRQCEICRSEYRIARAAALAVGMSAAQDPPANLRERILRSLASPEASSTVRSLPQRRSWFVPAAAAAAVILAAGAWWANQHRAQTWAAACVPGTNCHASGVLSLAGSDQMHLEVKGLATLPAGKAYQAWVIVPGSAPKPEPMLRTDSHGNGSIDISFLPPEGTMVALTVEPAAGSSAPTSKPFLIATVE